MTHSTVHFYSGLALAAATLAMMVAVPNRFIRRRLLFSGILWIAFVGLHLALTALPSLLGAGATAESIERLLFALALINAVVTIAFNPWFKEQGSDRTPAIVQDAIVLVLFAVVATLTFKDSAKALTASAAAALAISFALQETLGNAFAGLAIQVEKPFRVGHWIAVGTYDGRVTEVTWRATRIRTKNGNLVVLPNNFIAREAITNYSQPVAPTRITVDVGASYGMPPNDVREALLAAMRRSSWVLATPEPDVIVNEFADSAIIYRARFWINDFEFDEPARNEVRTAIYYEFHRRGIDIPWPIRVLYQRQDAPHDSPERREGFVRTVAAVPVLASLSPDAHRALAQAAEERLYAGGEVVVREGEPGGSMFLIRRGRVAVTVGADHREVAVTEAGGYFGEMSLLTGEPRTATVTARGDCTVLEISADAFRAYVKSHPEVIDQLATAAGARRHELDKLRSTAPDAPAVEGSTLAQRMRRFFGLT
jgi:small-conductance mechanosensitive channel